MTTPEELRATLNNNITHLNEAFLRVADTLLVPFEGKCFINNRDYQAIEDMRVELHRAHYCISAMRKLVQQIGTNDNATQ